MEKEDYLKKQIDQLGRILGKVLFNSLGIQTFGEMSGPSEQADIDEIESELNLDYPLLALTEEEFLDRLKSDRRWTSQNIDLLAEFLMNAGLNRNYFSPKGLNKKDLLRKALLAFEFVNESTATFSVKRQNCIDKIKNAL